MVEKTTEKTTGKMIRYDITAGTISFLSGNYRGKDLAIWDAVTQCEGNRCPAFARCPSPLKLNDLEELPDKCPIQLKYVKTAVKRFVTHYVPSMTDSQIYSFGMHIVPLIAHLSKMKIIEAGLSFSDMFPTSKRGTFVHPVYREIRSTLFTIAQVSKQAGIDPIALGASKIRANKGEGSIMDQDILDVDPNELSYYEQMNQQEDKTPPPRPKDEKIVQNVLRRKRNG